jgi:hypothetical protein
VGRGGGKGGGGRSGEQAQKGQLQAGKDCGEGSMQQLIAAPYTQPGCCLLLCNQPAIHPPLCPAPSPPPSGSLPPPKLQAPAPLLPPRPAPVYTLAHATPSGTPPAPPPPPPLTRGGAGVAPQLPRPVARLVQGGGGGEVEHNGSSMGAAVVQGGQGQVALLARGVPSVCEGGGGGGGGGGEPRGWW